MLKNIISQGDFAFWPQLSLVIFLVAFISILVWVFRKNARTHYHYMATLTQENKQNGEPTWRKN